MQAGRLRHQVEIQEKTPGKNDFGEAVMVWGPMATVRASVDPLRGAERMAMQQVQGAVSHLVTIRYRSDVTERNRLLFGTRVLNIKAVVNPLERNERLELHCEEEK